MTIGATLAPVAGETDARMTRTYIPIGIRLSDNKPDVVCAEQLAVRR
jgi:hypothetical protein